MCLSHRANDDIVSRVALADFRVWAALRDLLWTASSLTISTEGRLRCDCLLLMVERFDVPFFIFRFFVFLFYLPILSWFVACAKTLVGEFLVERTR